MSYSLHLFADTPAAITAAVYTPYLVDRVYGAAITSAAAVAIGVADAAAALHSRHLYCCSAVAVDIAGASTPLAASSFATATTVLSPSLVMSNVCTAPPLLTPYPFTVNVADAAAAGRPTSVPFRCYRCRSPLTVAAGSLLPPPPLLSTSLAISIVWRVPLLLLPFAADGRRRFVATATTVAVDVPCHIDRLHGSTPSLKPPPFAVDVVDAAVPLAAPPPYRSVAIFYRHRQLSLLFAAEEETVAAGHATAAPRRSRKSACFSRARKQVRFWYS